MKLHLDETIYQEFITCAANELKINPLFVEKDY